MTTRQAIDQFLGLHRLALVGVSRNPHDFSRMLFRELRREGYDIIPINPHLADVDGTPCFGKIQDVSPPVEGALLLTSAEASAEVVRDCVSAGVRHVWMHRSSGAGAVNSGAVAMCQEHDIACVPGECPLMFLPRAGWFHRLHGFCRKILGHYPL